MLGLYVDFNSCEGKDVIVVRLDIELNAKVSENEMIVGERVLLYDEEMECEAVLQRGAHARWVAVLDVDTIKHLPEALWDRLKRS